MIRSRELRIFAVLTMAAICSIVQLTVYQNKPALEYLTTGSFTNLTLDDVPNVTVSSVNCSALFANNADEMAKAERFQSSNYTQQTTKYVPEMFIDQTKDCRMFKTKRRYLATPVNSEEAEFPLAFSILMFKDVEQFERLLRAIYRPQNIYCVHVDKKSTSLMKNAVRAIASCFHNVFVTQKSYDVKWGTVTVLAPELLCMKELVRRDKKWKYFINLTGQEFPLKTNWQIIRILKAFNGSNNMEGTIRRCVMLSCSVMQMFMSNVPASA
jgi:beta-1,3-galactosyl-O-glycosyl-glycoprotein beta-1,6-N-acetylglucosaminyltransferase